MELKPEEDLVQYPNATPPWPEWNEEEFLSEINLEEEILSTHSEVETFRYRDYPIVIDRDRKKPQRIDSEQIEWRRVNDIFPHEEYQVIDSSQPPFLYQDNVFASNRHLMGTEIFRHLLYSLKNISFLSCTKTSATLEEWEPQHLVYRAEYNPHGIYYVRLFYLGKWRRIIVDDALPCDRVTRRILVPFLSPKQLWLPLLCKAVLVVASLSQFDWKRARFSNLLTGGFSYYCDRRGMTETEAWEWVESNVPHRKDDEGELEEGLDEANIRDSSQDSGSYGTRSFNMAGYERYILIVVESAAIPNLNTKLPIQVELVINQCHWKKFARTWKEIRYNNWAFEKGILKEKIPSSNGIPNIQIFCPVRRLNPEPPQTEVNTRNVSRQTNIKTPGVSIMDEDDHSDISHGFPTSKEICTWLEFPSVYSHLVRMETLYVPSTFQYQRVYHSVEELKAESCTIIEGGSQTEENEETEETHIYHDAVPPVISEHFYLFLDNLHPGILFFVVEKCDIYSTKSSRLVVNHVAEPSLIVEPWCWRDETISDKCVHICCDGFKHTRVVKVRTSPGTNVFKLWYVGCQHLHVAIYCTDDFQTVPRYHLNNLLCGISQHLNKLVRDVQARISTLLVTEVGIPEHGRAYNEFIECFCSRKYFHPDTSIKEKVQIKAGVLQKFETLFMEKILAYDFDIQPHTICFPLQSTTSIVPPLDSLIVQVVLDCQTIFQDPAFGEKFLKLNAPHYYQQIVLFKRHLLSQSIINNTNKSSKTLKMSKSQIQKKKQHRSKTQVSAPTSAPKSSVMSILLADIMERHANEFYRLMAVAPGTEQEEVLLSDIKHSANCIELSGILETPPTSDCILARININVHSTAEALVGVFCQLANAGDLKVHCDVVRNSVPYSPPLIPHKILDHVFKISRSDYGYTILMYGHCHHVNKEEPTIRGSSISHLAHPGDEVPKPSRKTLDTHEVLSENRLDSHSDEIRWNLQLLSIPGPDSLAHVCHLYPCTMSIHSQDELEDQIPGPMCDFGHRQTAPGFKKTEFFDSIKSETKYDRLKFRIYTWEGNNLSLRFRLKSTHYMCTLRITKTVRKVKGDETKEKHVGGTTGRDMEGGMEKMCGFGMARSALSFGGLMEENETVEEYEDITLVTEHSKNGEIFLPGIVTTSETCNRDTRNHSNKYVNNQRNEDLGNHRNQTVGNQGNQTTRNNNNRGFSNHGNKKLGNYSNQKVGNHSNSNMRTHSNTSSGNHSNTEFSNYDNRALVLEGTVEIVFVEREEDQDDGVDKIARKMMNAKIDLIKKRLTKNPEKRTKKVVFNCPDHTTPYSFSVFTTEDESLDPDKEIILEVQQDLLAGDDVDRETVLEKITEGRQRRNLFLAEVYKNAKCLGRWKAKVPHLENVLRQVFDKYEESELDNLNVNDKVTQDETPQEERITNVEEDSEREFKEISRESGIDSRSLHKSRWKSTSRSNIESKSLLGGMENNRDGYESNEQFEMGYESTDTQTYQLTEQEVTLERIKKGVEDTSGPKRIRANFQVFRRNLLLNGPKKHEGKLFENNLPVEATPQDTQTNPILEIELDRVESSEMEEMDSGVSDSMPKLPLNTKLYEEEREALLGERDAIIRRREEELAQYWRVETPISEVMRVIELEEEPKPVKEESKKISKAKGSKK